MRMSGGRHFACRRDVLPIIEQLACSAKEKQWKKIAVQPTTYSYLVYTYSKQRFVTYHLVLNQDTSFRGAPGTRPGIIIVDT